jgi:type IV pilus assembly protein PilX
MTFADSRRAKRTPLRMTSPRNRNKGAALAVGLILLMVITLLAISGMNTSTLELQMAGNAQFARKALVASDFAIDDALTQITYDTAAVITRAKTKMTTAATEVDWYQSVTQADNTEGGVTNVPGTGMSMKVGGGQKAYHFDITATGSSARNAQVGVRQGFYIVGPGGG